jgi:UrcA family protein
MNTTKVTTTTRAMTACIAATLGCYAAETFAGSLTYDQRAAGTPPRYLVQFSDLDLSRMEGATALYRRIRYAARMACDPIQTQQLGLAEKYRACVDQAIANAVAGVNSPLLTQYFQLHTRGDGAGLVQLAKTH